MCRRYEEAGIDLLLCLVNPYKHPPRGRDGDHRAHGDRGHPKVRRMTPAVGPQVGAIPTMGLSRVMAPVEP